MRSGASAYPLSLNRNSEFPCLFRSDLYAIRRKLLFHDALFFFSARSRCPFAFFPSSRIDIFVKGRSRPIRSAVLIFISTSDTPIEAVLRWLFRQRPFSYLKFSSSWSNRLSLFGRPPQRADDVSIPPRLCDSLGFTRRSPVECSTFTLD